MELKRIYDDNNNVVDVEVVREGGREKHLSTRFVENGIAQGWLEISNKQMTFGDLTFDIQRAPGHYCCHCEKKLDDAAVAIMHLADEHNGVESPDETNPSGYRRDNFFAVLRKD